MSRLLNLELNTFPHENYPQHRWQRHPGTDCGIAQGHDPLVPFNQLPVPPADIDYLFLTHAHIDHIGRTQELIYELDRINPGVPVFIDSPSGIRITRPQMLVRFHIKPHGKQGKLGRFTSSHPRVNITFLIFMPDTSPT
ncbi:MAG: MBL fold metallo-hydrolase [Desulfobacteraceae bacterium]|nr:MBL fold metallo-hydrolase [Desulfobacteraceae bacterium]